MVKESRNRPYLNRIDLSKRILEIGPLNNPTFKKVGGNNVFYADIRSTEELKIHYGGDYVEKITSCMTQLRHAGCRCRHAASVCRKRKMFENYLDILQKMLYLCVCIIVI